MVSSLAVMQLEPRFDKRSLRKDPADPASVDHTRTMTQTHATNAPPQRNDPTTPPVYSRELPPIGEYIEHYEVLRPLGSGGMGTVLLARDTKLGRLVAIKLLHEGGEAAAQVLLEGRATARARHENIVVIYEVGTFNARPYMVLEYLEGRTLRQAIAASAHLRSGNCISPSLALEIIVSVLRALVAAHKSGIVHRDLKPENIMLLDTGQVKVLDFGIARFADSNGLNERKGTRAYMSPEQWRGDDIDERSDLWAVGILLYELLAGVHPLDPISAENLASIADPNIPMPNLRAIRPEFAALSEVLARCLQKNPDERFHSAADLLAALEPFVARSKWVPTGEMDCPFAGLSAFQEADADRFFGRERNVLAVLGLLERQPLVMVAGASGAGKSSFVRAGVLPALRCGSEHWDIFVVRPGRAPIAALREAIRLPDESGDRPPNRVQWGAELRARCTARGTSQRILVFIDQFEELYTLTSDIEERTEFLAGLLGIADDASSPLRVIACIRSDFLDRVVEDPAFMANVTAGLFFLPPVDRNGQRDSLVLPAEQAGYHFENEALLETMLDELARAKNPLPLLQFAASKLWENRDTNRKLLTQKAYETMGGVGGALAIHADTVVSRLSADDQARCRAIFMRLVTPEHTRTVANLQELTTLAENASAIEAIVQQLAAARLLQVDTDAGNTSTKVEIVHESLIERWPTLAQWLDESAGDAHFLTRLRVTAMQWEAGDRGIGLLWRDRAAEEARGFYERYQQEKTNPNRAPLGLLEAQYLQAVVDHLDRNRRLRNRAITAGFCILCGVVAIVLFFALDARKEARRADDEADRVRDQNGKLAIQALRGRNATRLLAARKHKDDPTLVLALLREVEAPDVPKDWPELVSAALSTGVARDLWRTDPARCGYDAVLSPDGTRIAVAMDDHTARILDEHLRELVVLRGHEKLVWSVDWSPDGRHIVTASNDQTARIWSADGQGTPIVLQGHTDALNSAKWSPDGQRIATSADDKTARIWNAQDGRELSILHHDVEVTAAEWTPDGKQIITAANNPIVRVWNADGTGEPRSLIGHTDIVMAASVHPKGKFVATVGRDRTVRVWPLQGKGEPLVLRGHEEKILAVEFSPDGERIATASKDKTARIWRTDGKGVPIVLHGHTHWVYTATWSPDGKQILTDSLDGTQRRFFLDDIVAPMVLQGHEDTVRGLAFSPDGKHIATASYDTTARIWNADGSGDPLILRGHSGYVTVVRWSPDGARLATIAADKTIRIWQKTNAAPPVVLSSAHGVFQSVDWSPDSQHLVTTANDGVFQIWNVDGVELSRVSKKTTSEFKFLWATFDSAGKTILVVDTSDSVVYQWKREPSSQLAPIGDMGEAVRIAKWSPDESKVLAVSTPGQVRIWDVAGKEPPIQIRAPHIVHNGLWQADGRSIVLMLENGTLLPWSNGSFGDPIGAGVVQEGAVTASFSADGRRLLTSTPYGKVRVRRTDGTGAPFVLDNATPALSFSYWSPRDERIATHYEDKFAWVWPSVEPFSGTDDARLWSVTSYCIPAAKRVDFLGVSETEAQADEEACKRRVMGGAGK